MTVDDVQLVFDFIQRAKTVWQFEMDPDVSISIVMNKNEIDALDHLRMEYGELCKILRSIQFSSTVGLV
jgi:hypothetical protein